MRTGRKLSGSECIGLGLVAAASLLALTTGCNPSAPPAKPPLLATWETTPLRQVLDVGSPDGSSVLVLGTEELDNTPVLRSYDRDGGLLAGCSISHDETAPDAWQAQARLELQGSRAYVVFEGPSSYEVVAIDNHYEVRWRCKGKWTDPLPAAPGTVELEFLLQQRKSPSGNGKLIAISAAGRPVWSPSGEWNCCCPDAVGRFYAPSRKRLQKFDRLGNSLWSLELPEDRVHAVTVAEDGSLYLICASWKDARVASIQLCAVSASGKLRWSLPGDFQPFPDNDVAGTPDSMVLVGNQLLCRTHEGISRVSTNGKLEETFPRQGNLLAFGTLQERRAAWLEYRGDINSPNSGVAGLLSLGTYDAQKAGWESRNLDGDEARAYGWESEEQFCWCAGGLMFVYDYQSGRLKVYDPQ